MDIVFVLKIILIIMVFIIAILLLRRSIAIKKAKRIGSYSLEPLKDDGAAFSDRIVHSYYLFVVSFRKYISKIKYFKTRAKRYDKYIKYKDRKRIENIDFFTSKYFISIVFLILTIFSQVFSGKLSLFSFVINFMIGYYILDIYLYFYYRRQTKLIENELLRAVIIMNNVFKSGKSTLQALKIASEELPEPINDEFKKMYLDMKYGLSVDAVFERFAKRVKLDAAVYLSSSLTILNRTGGDIVEVFSSIERTLFDSKKLDEELKNISANPNMVVRILFMIPIVFVLIIYILDPTYFAPLFSNVLGYILIIIALIMFVIYVLLLKRILKVEV